MRKAINLTFITFIILIFAGCAAVPSGPAYSVAKAKGNKAGYSTLYIYREYAEPTAWGPRYKLMVKK